MKKKILLSHYVHLLQPLLLLEVQELWITLMLLPNISLVIKQVVIKYPFYNESCTNQLLAEHDLLVS